MLYCKMRHGQARHKFWPHRCEQAVHEGQALCFVLPKDAVQVVKTDLIAVAVHPDLFYQVTCAEVHLQLLSSNVLSCSRLMAGAEQ